jgi:hypothetical protein
MLFQAYLLLCYLYAAAAAVLFAIFYLLLLLMPETTCTFREIRCSIRRIASNTSYTTTVGSKFHPSNKAGSFYGFALAEVRSRTMNSTKW